MSQRSAQEPQLQLGDSWVTETDGSFEVGENTSTSDSDTKGAPQNTLHRRETPRRITRSTAKKIEPELVMPAIDDDDGKGKSGEVDRRKAEGSRIMPAIDDDGGKGRSGHGGRRRAEGSRRVPLRPATEDTFPRRRSARLANGNEKVHSQPVNRQDQTSKQDLQQTRKEIVQESFSTQVLMESLESLGLWMFNTLKMVVKLLKYPASICLAVLIAAMIISYFIAFLSNLMSKAISAPFSSIPFSSLPSICRLPIVSVLCQLPTNFRETNSPVEFDEMMKVQAKFEEVLESSADSVALPLDMKRGEASIRDLRQLVRYSSLRAKNELVLEFDGFIETARMASYDLQRYNSHIGRAVDNILATTRWTMRALDDIAFRDSSGSAVQLYVADKLPWFFKRTGSSEKALVDQYIQHTRVVEEEINKLIAEAQTLLLVLGNLEDRLDVIHGIVTRENGHAMESKEEILTQLWTMLGGNRGILSKMNRQLKLLGEVGKYRQNAYAHVSGTVLRLQEIGAGLEDLRERVGAPELLRDRSDVPLSIHLESIQSGVERLEASRHQAKKLESDHLKKVLVRGQSDEQPMRIEGSF